jgi:hypothetical protein
MKIHGMSGSRKHVVVESGVEDRLSIRSIELFTMIALIVENTLIAGFIIQHLVRKFIQMLKLGIE